MNLLRYQAIGWKEDLDFTRWKWAVLWPVRHPGNSWSRRRNSRSRRVGVVHGQEAYMSSRQRRASLLRTRAGLGMALKGVAILGMAVVIFLMMVVGVGVLWMYAPPKTFEAQHLAHARPAIIDSDGELVGAAPGLRSVSTAGNIGIRDEEARMAAIIVRDVPPVWWDVAVALEDKRFGQTGKGWIYGIDLLGFLHVLTGRGGSSLPMQLVGNLTGDKARQNDAGGSRWQKFKRKLREWGSTPTLVLDTQDDDYLWLKRLIATHLPVMAGQIGGNTQGVAGGGWVMFGKTPSQLSPGEQAILAAALNKNILMRKEPDDKVRERWDFVKSRAKRGLVLAYPDTTDPRRVQGIREIDAMPNLPPLFFDEDLPLAARAHVVHRRTITARAVVTEAQTELGDAYGLKQLSGLPLRGYQLTLSATDNYDFMQRMDQIAATLTESLGRKCALFIPLGNAGFRDTTFQFVTNKPQCAPSDLPKEERAQVLAVLANERGELLRFYQSGSETSIFSGAMGRTANDGHYDSSKEIRDIGSIAKIAVAIFLAHEGDRPDQRYCREYFQDKLDSDGSTGFKSCGAPGAMIEAREAFARSSNLAILWRLRQFSSARLRALADALELKMPASLDPAIALAYGQVTASPGRVMNLMHHIGIVSLDRASNQRNQIHVLKSIEVGDGAPNYAVGRALSANAVRGYLDTPEARVYSRAVLSAVLTHPHGTMRFLREFTPDADPSIAAHMGKTGTPVNQNNIATDKLVIGSLVKNGHYYSYLVMIRAPNPGKYPLGRKLEVRYFAPLVTTLLEEIGDIQSRQKSVVKPSARNLT